MGSYKSSVTKILYHPQNSGNTVDVPEPQFVLNILYVYM